MQLLAPGVELRKTPHGIAVLRLHYTADKEKSEGEKTYVPELNMELSPWALAQYTGMTNKLMYRQELEIDAEATQGALLYQMDENATVEDDFPIPPEWTRYMALDPHPGVPDASLWCAVDPWGDRWYYREFWPSRICYRMENGLLSGKDGPCPSDDFRVSIEEYVNCIKHLESDKNAANVTEKGVAFNEAIRERVIDYAARAFGKGTSDDPEQENFQQRYEKYLNLAPKATKPFFSDAKKDHNAGFERVQNGLRVRQVKQSDGTFTRKSAIRIFKSCQELIHQIKNVRLKVLTPTQSLQHDPPGTQVTVRNHMTDLIRYIEMANPVYVKPRGFVFGNSEYADGFTY